MHDGFTPVQVVSAQPDASAEARSVYRCDGCGRKIVGAPAGRGLFLWSRGDEVRLEEPPLCERCLRAVAFRFGQLPDWDE